MLQLLTTTRLQHCTACVYILKSMQVLWKGNHQLTLHHRHCWVIRATLQKILG